MSKTTNVISTPATTASLAEALLVMTLTRHIREYLEANDPKALEQAERALLFAGVPEPYRPEPALNQSKPPLAVTNYARWYGLTLEDVRRFILGQITFYQERQDKHGRLVEEWIAVRLECGPAEALDAIEWAKADQKEVS